jgi:hypothetical protein
MLSDAARYGTLSNLDLHPAVGEALYFKPLTQVAASGCDYNQDQSLPTCIPTGE